MYIKSFISYLIGMMIALNKFQGYRTSGEKDPINSKISYAIKNFESFSDLIFCILVVDLHGHHGQEFWKIYRAGSVFINFVHHILKISIRSNKKIIKRFLTYHVINWTSIILYERIIITLFDIVNIIFVQKDKNV